jgi:hypothetical protein
VIPVARLGVTSVPEREPDERDNQLAVTAHRECSQRTASVPRQFATLLGLEVGGLMVERVIKLLVDGQPILTSTSYLPIELGLADNLEDWHNVDIGGFAVVGYAAIPAGFMESWSR